VVINALAKINKKIHTTKCNADYFTSGPKKVMAGPQCETSQSSAVTSR
jgi:hypothetical protein